MAEGYIVAAAFDSQRIVRARLQPARRTVPAPGAIRQRWSRPTRRLRMLGRSRPTQLGFSGVASPEQETPAISGQQ